MCGVAGFVDKLTQPLDAPEQSLRAMLKAINHRGPDGQGIWSDASHGLFIGHCRLAIQDLSEQGRQPMISANQRYILTFNGEIYNFPQLKMELQNTGNHYPWQGHSDTEVLLAAIQCWGLEKALQNSVGMFAFVLYDRQQKLLYLVRDRLGEKPLYYGFQNDQLWFASELKALTQHPNWQPQINRDALALLLRHNYIPAPYSIYQDVKKLLPGSIVRFSLTSRNISEPQPYWSMQQVSETAIKQPFTGTFQEATVYLDGLLKQSIRGQMLADVPLGAFLSGGIDSSLVVALMQNQSPKRIKSFAIGFEEPEYNEAGYAKAVANHLGTEHTELYVNAKQVLEVIPKMPAIYDEPFADPSQLPTLLVCEMTRQHVTVALSGDGGDELFGGYSRYQQTQRIWHYLSAIPANCRPRLKTLLQSIPVSLWDIGFKLFANQVKALKAGRGGDRLHKLAEIIDADSCSALYRNMMSYWQQPNQLVLGATEPLTALNAPGLGQDFMQQMMYSDTISYLPDDILTKVDRAAMAVSLETRIPLLDHRVVEFAFSLPQTLRFQQGQSKWLLRQLLYQYVPKNLLDRPKAGFAVPLESWLRGELRDWAENLLDANRLQQQGFFNVVIVRQKWTEHKSGKRNWHYYLWSILMFQMWLDNQ